MEITNATGKIKVPFEDLLDFVAQYVLGKKMEALEKDVHTSNFTHLRWTPLLQLMIDDC